MKEETALVEEESRSSEFTLQSVFTGLEEFCWVTPYVKGCA